MTMGARRNMRPARSRRARHSGNKVASLVFLGFSNWRRFLNLPKRTVGPPGDRRCWRPEISDLDQAMARAVGRAMGKSADLLREAADAGDAEAQFALGLLYLLGRGVEKNLGEAFELFGLAAEAGDEQAASFREMAVEQMAREQLDRRKMEDATVAVMTEAKRRQRFPKPKLIEPE